MDAHSLRRSLPRQLAAISVVIALALVSGACGADIPRGKVIFSTDAPKADGVCSPGNAVTEIADKTSVYATYVFKDRPGSETLSLSVTKDGASYIPASDLPSADTTGLDCFADTTDLSTLPNWGSGTYHVSVVNGSTVVTEGDLTVK
jgi:hypothetical protein